MHVSTRSFAYCSTRGSFTVRTALVAAVRIRGPSAVIATVCSKCAASEPSALEIDHSSSCSTTSGPPAVIIGSIAKVIPSASSGPRPGLAVVRDLRLLVHRAADAVADQAADDGEALLLGGDLDRVRDVREPVADAALLDPGRERGLAALEQALGLLGDLADRERVGRVGDEAVERHADVHGEDVAVPQRVHAGNAVDDHLVRRGADRGRVAAVALEGRRAAARADELVGQLVELLRGHARPRVLAEQRERVGDHLAGAGHALDLGRRPCG